MSMIPGISSQPSEFADGMKVNTISELTSTNGVQLQGRTSGVAIGSGLVGETFIQSKTYANRTGIANNNTAVNVTASPLALPSGIWLLSATVGWDFSTTTAVTFMMGSISRTSATSPSGPLAVPMNGESQSQDYPVGWATGTGIKTMIIPSAMVALSSSTNFYLVAGTSYSAATLSENVFGSIWAVRIA